jgi:ANTAR domain-containing protein
MSGSELASDTADLLSLSGASQPRSLNRLVTMAARQVRACSGASAGIWHGAELISLVASHPDLPALTEVQLGAGRGPVLDALAGGEPISVPDTLAEQRWPEFTAAALRRGVRCSVSLAYHAEQEADPKGRAAVTLSLFGARPRLLESSQLELAEMLIAYGAAVVGNAADYGDVRRTAQQLQDAAQARTLVDQARGKLMQSLGCTADEAMQWLRRVSQERNIRVADVASRILAAEGMDSLKPRRSRRR